MGIDDEENAGLLKSVNADDNSYGSTESISYRDIALTNKIRRRTFNVLYFTMFVGSISFSIVMSSLWPFLRKLDHSVSEPFMGYINAGYSLSQMVSSVIFGYWCDRRRGIEPLVLSCVLLALGSGLYAYAQPFGADGIWVVFGARLMLGLSAGSVSVARTVGARLSTEDERGKIMSYISLWQAIGFFIGPALQALSKVVPSNGVYVSSIKFYFDIYTAPCYMMIILSVVNAVSLTFYYVEDVGGAKEKFKEEVKRLRRVSISFEPIDFPVIIVCIILWFVSMSIFALNETILSPLIMNEYAWSRSKTVFYGSVLLSVSGVVAIMCFLLTAPLAKKLGDRAVVLIGFLIMLAGFIIYLPWGPGYPKLTMAVLKMTNGTVVTNDASEGGGCPYSYAWCHNTPSLSFGQFLTGATLVGIGYPVTVVILNVLYSKTIGPFPQGKYMGWLSGAGCFARVTGPLYVTAMYRHYGMRWTAVSIICMLTLVLVLFAIFWRRLVPYNKRRRVMSKLESYTAGNPSV